MFESAGLFQRIRSRCAEVTRRADSVEVDDEAVARFAARLAAGPWPEADLDPAHHFRGDAQATLSFVFALDAINFGSGWFPVLRKRAGLSGYRTVASACKERFEREGALNAEALRRTTPTAMAELLGQDAANAEAMELMALFAEAWRSLGDWLGERFEDRFENVLEEASHSAERLARLLSEMPLYRDTVRYREIEVPFYKRAQITAADLHLAFGGAGLGRFHDLEQQTLFADNLVPHVLRCEGVLVYRDALAAEIDARRLIEPGSAWETEMRAAAVEATERLVKEIGARGRKTTARELDGLLWNAGQAPEIKARPRHRSRGTFY